MRSLTANEIEAANRAEATAILIRAGCRVYRSEADAGGVDLLISRREGELLQVQMKSRPTVDWQRYGENQIWMLFPDPKGDIPGRPWFLVKHDDLFGWVKARHGAASGWKEAWSYPHIGVELRSFLQSWVLQPSKAEVASEEPAKGVSKEHIGLARAAKHLHKRYGDDLGRLCRNNT
jgi:hypothetical protein